MGHVVQELAPAGAKEPAPQTVGADAGEAHEKPAGHVMHTPAVEKVPPGQLVHAEAEALLNRPPPHTEHVLEAAPADVPATHCVQAELPASDTSPTPHAAHAVEEALFWKRPMLHAVQIESPVELAKRPGAQDEQVEDKPEAKVPTGHVRALPVPTGQGAPDGHGSQVTDPASTLRVPAAQL